MLLYVHIHVGRVATVCLIDDPQTVNCFHI